MASGNLMSSEGWDDTVLVGIFDAAVKSHTTTDKKFTGKGLPGPWMEMKGEWAAQEEDIDSENIVSENGNQINSEQWERLEEENFVQTQLPSVSEFEQGIGSNVTHLESSVTDLLDDLSIHDMELNAAISEGYQQMQQAWYQAGYQAGRYETLLLLQSMRKEKASTTEPKSTTKKKKKKKKKVKKKAL